MAYKELTPVKRNVNTFTMYELVSSSGSQGGFTLKAPRTSDENILIIAQNSGSGKVTLTIKKPETGSYAAACEDLSYELDTLDTGIFTFESAKWANRDGSINIAVSSTMLQLAAMV